MTKLFVVASTEAGAEELIRLYQYTPSDAFALKMIRDGYINQTREQAEKAAQDIASRVVGLPWPILVWEKEVDECVISSAF